MLAYPPYGYHLNIPRSHQKSNNISYIVLLKSNHVILLAKRLISIMIGDKTRSQIPPLLTT